MKLKDSSLMNALVQYFLQKMGPQMLLRKKQESTFHFVPSVFTIFVYNSEHCNTASYIIENLL